MKNKTKKIHNTFFDYIVLVLILLIVFFSFDLYLFVKQNYFSSQLKLKELSKIEYVSVIDDLKNLEDTSVQDKKEDAGELEKQNSTEQALKKEESQSVDNVYNIDTDFSVFQTTRPEQVFVANSQIEIISNNVLFAYDMQGTKLWTRDITAQKPMILQNAKDLVIVNKTAGSIAKIDKDNKIIANVDSLGELDIIKSANKYVVAKIKYMNRLVVLDENLHTHATIDINYGDIVDFQLSKNEDVIMISTLKINDFKLESYILQYSIDGVAIGTNDMDGELVYGMVMNKNTIIATDDSIRALDENGTLIKKQENRDMLFSMKYNDEKLYFVNMVQEEETVEEAEKILIKSMQSQKSQPDVNMDIGIEVSTYSLYLEKLNSTKLDNIDNLMVSNKFVVINDSGKISLYDTRMNLIDSKKVPINVHSLKWIDEHNFLIIGQDMIYVYNIG